MPAAETDHDDNLIAPPMNLLTTTIRKKVGNSQAAFVAHVTGFAVRPSPEKVKAMAEAVDRFGLMPPIGETAPFLSSDDLLAVAEWLFVRYDYEKEITDLEERIRQQNRP